MIAVMSMAILGLLEPLGGRRRELAAGEYLFHLGDPVTAVFAALDGEVQLLRHLQDGAAIVLQRAIAGQLLAEASLFSDRYHCDAVAAIGSTVLRVAKRRVRARFRDDPAFAEAWATHVAQEMQSARLRSEILAMRTVSARLDAWLAWHGRLPPKGEWRCFAQQIGVSPEALYRELAKRRDDVMAGRVRAT